MKHLLRRDDDVISSIHVDVHVYFRYKTYTARVCDDLLCMWGGIEGTKTLISQVSAQPPLQYFQQAQQIPSESKFERLVTCTK
jgi:hypothetical protein